jgi:hypothetical protein
MTTYETLDERRLIPEEIFSLLSSRMVTKSEETCPFVCHAYCPVDTINVQEGGGENKYAILFDRGANISPRRMEQVTCHGRKR